MDHGLTRAIEAGDGPRYWAFDKARPEDLQALSAYNRKRNNPVETERIGIYPQDGKRIQMAGGHAAGGSENHLSGIMPLGYDCSTEKKGLYAAGDCLSTRSWGAVKDGAPWGVIPALVTGKIAAHSAAAAAKKNAGPVRIDREQAEHFAEKQYEPLRRTGGMDPRWVVQLLQNQVIPYYVWQLKEEQRLNAALTFVEFFRDRMAPKLIARDYHELRLVHETRNMIFHTEVMLRSSIMRKETRGRHIREDYPDMDPDWNAIIKVFEENGKIKLDKIPVRQEIGGSL